MADWTQVHQVMTRYRNGRLIHAVNHPECIKDEIFFPPELSREAEAREIAKLFEMPTTDMDNAPRRIEGLVDGKWIPMNRQRGFYADGKIQFPEAWRPVACDGETTDKG
jgi:hypothetical protein